MRLERLFRNRKNDRVYRSIMQGLREAVEYEQKKQMKGQHAMSMDYVIYAEVNVAGVWHSLCPCFPTPRGGCHTGEIYHTKSVFYSVCNELRSYECGTGVPDDISDELSKYLERNVETDPYETGEPSPWQDEYRNSMFYVDFSKAIAPRIKKDRPYKYEGYVLKRDAADFEVYETDEIESWMTPNEYDALSDGEKKAYMYYQWNDRFGDYDIYMLLYTRIRTLADLFAETMWSVIDGIGFDDISDSQIRVLIDVY